MEKKTKEAPEEPETAEEDVTDDVPTPQPEPVETPVGEEPEDETPPPLPEEDDGILEEDPVETPPEEAPSEDPEPGSEEVKKETLPPEARALMNIVYNSVGLFPHGIALVCRKDKETKELTLYMAKKGNLEIHLTMVAKFLASVTTTEEEELNLLSFIKERISTFRPKAPVPTE